MTEKPGLVLGKNEERRLEAGHLWIFSNEVDTKRTPLTAIEPGAQVPLWSSRGKFLAMAGVNPHSLICARVYSYARGEALDGALLGQRLQNALQLREAQFDKPFYRLVNAEGDWLPGLVVDRFIVIARGNRTICFLIGQGLNAVVGGCAFISTRRAPCCYYGQRYENGYPEFRCRHEHQTSHKSG